MDLTATRLPGPPPKACALRKYGCKAMFRGDGILCPKCAVYAADDDSDLFRSYVARGCRESRAGPPAEPTAWAWEKYDGAPRVAPDVVPVIETVKRELKEEKVAQCASRACTKQTPMNPKNGRPRLYCSTQCNWRENDAKKRDLKNGIAPRRTSTPEPAEAPADVDAGAVAPAAEPELPAPSTALVALPQPKNVEDEIAPAAAFICELHKALALMPRVAGVSVTITVLRDGSVAIAPPVYREAK